MLRKNIVFFKPKVDKTDGILLIQRVKNYEYSLKMFLNVYKCLKNYYLLIMI